MHAAQRAGFIVIRQRGSHIRMAKGSIRITIPARCVTENTLHHIMRAMDINRDELKELIKKK